MAAGCYAPPEIEPIFIIVDVDEKVSLGTGPARVVLDRDKSDRTLTNLDQRLSAYQHAAEAASSVAAVQIYVAPSAPYQRMIDVLACVEWNRIERVFFIDMPDGPEMGCGGLPLPELRLKPMVKPRAPSGLGPLGLAPRENRLPEPPFDPDLD